VTYCIRTVQNIALQLHSLFLEISQASMLLLRDTTTILPGTIPRASCKSIEKKSTHIESHTRLEPCATSYRYSRPARQLRERGGFFPTTILNDRVARVRFVSHVNIDDPYHRVQTARKIFLRRGSPYCPSSSSRKSA